MVPLFLLFSPSSGEKEVGVKLNVVLGQAASCIKGKECFVNDAVIENSSRDKRYMSLKRMEPRARGYCQGASRLQRAKAIVHLQQGPEFPKGADVCYCHCGQSLACLRKKYSLSL